MITKEMISNIQENHINGIVIIPQPQAVAITKQAHMAFSGESLCMYMTAHPGKSLIYPRKIL